MLRLILKDSIQNVTFSIIKLLIKCTHILTWYQLILQIATSIFKQTSFLIELIFSSIYIIENKYQFKVVSYDAGETIIFST